MKTKIATALSLVGVLGAGSAAALVNTQILDSGPAGADTSAILTPSTPLQSSTTAASTSSTSTTAATSTTVATTIAPVVITPAPAPAVSPFLTSYDLGAPGLVTVDVVAGATTVVAATPNPGWTLAATETDPSQNEVEVTFTDGTTLVELEVRFDGVSLLPEVSSSLVGASADTTTNITATRNTIDDDDDDDTRNTIDDDDDDDHGGDDDDHDDD
jgi:hypothetical protein